MTRISTFGNPEAGHSTLTVVMRRIVFLTTFASLAIAQIASAADVAGTARLIRERRGHTATALGGGKILVAGGQNLSGAISDVEIFDSATGTFTAAARLLTPRAEHTATRLADGRILLIGGRSGEPLTSTEFYDASRNVFSAGPALNSPRFGHSATLLPDGRIVVIGGNADGTAEIFDPRAGTFSALPCRLHEPRSFHASVRLLDGSILIAGGIDRQGVTLKSAEILHPDTLECEPVATMFAARARFTLRMLPDGKVQAIGGDADSTMELFNPAGYFSSLVHLARAPEFGSAAMRSAGRAALIGPNARPLLDGETTSVGGRESIRQIQNILDRVDYSLTEIPEAGTAIATGGVSSAGRYQQTAVLFESSAATVTTDMTDYAPGQTIVITGSGWLPGESVTLNIHRDSNDPPDTVLSAIADANGDILNAEYVVQDYDLGVTFLLTATGGTSGYTAQTSFTDSQPSGMSVTPASVTVNAGSSAVYSVLLNQSGNNNPCTITLSVTTALPTGAAASFSPNPVNMTTANVTSTLTITTTNTGPMSGRTPPGTYNFTVQAARGANCQGNGNLTAGATLVVGGNTPPVINRDNATVTANEGAPAANTGTWSDVNSGDTVTLTASVGTVTKAGTNAAGTWSWSFGTNDGPSQSQTVTITANDGNGGIATTTFALTVNNVAPTATFANNGPINEGGSATVSFTAPSDPSGPDTTGGFHYAFSCTNGDLSGATYAGSGTTTSQSCSFNDSGNFMVKGRIIDKDNGFTEYTTTVVVNNVAPTATIANNGPVNEGSAATVTFSGQSDPSSADTTAGFHYAYSCTNGSLAASNYGNSGTSATTSCTFGDNGTFTVRARIIDKDDGFTEYTTNVVVTNANPVVGAVTATPNPSNEGSSVTGNASFTDAGSLDTHTCSINWGDGNTTTGTVSESNGNGSCSGSHTYDDGPNTYTVTISVTDDDTGSHSNSTSHTVNNVPPTAALGSNGPVAEGSSAVASFSAQSDPSTADTNAGFHYAFSCTNGDLSAATYAGSPTTSSVSCPTNDNGTITIKGRIIDKDGGFTEHSTIVSVINVAPTATLSNNGPVDEGSPATISFTGQSDPSSVDTAAGFHYAFACDNGSLAASNYANSGTTASTNCTFDDNGTHTVRGRIIDKDGGFTEYTTDVTVSNANPTADLANNGPVNEGSPATITFSNQSDPSAADTAAGFRYVYSCSNGDLSGTNYATASTSATTSCTFGDNGTFTVKARIIDKDDGFTEYTTDVVVTNVAPNVGTPTSNSPTPEGSSATASVSFTDAGTLDTHTCSINWGDGNTTSGSVTETNGSGSCSGSHTYADNGSYTITFTVTDDDGDSDTGTVSHSVTNVPPTVGTPVLTPSPSNEGASVSLTASFTDPGTADTHTCSINWGDGNTTTGTVTQGSGSGTCSGSHTYDDGPKSWTVTVTVTDDDTGVGSNSTSHSVINVAPTATFNAPSSVDEGSSINISLTAPSDPSNADTLAGFQYAFDCGSGYGAYGASNTASCATNDNGSRTVKGKIKDKDNGETEYTATVTINNVAPTATLANNGPVNEGSPATVSFSNQFDSSSEDTNAGFHYAYACDNSPLTTATYANTAGSSASTTCTYPDNGTYTVRARIIDKDNGFTEYTTNVTVNNVAPAIDDDDLNVSPGTVNENGSVTLSGSFTDPGTLDTHDVTIHWGDGSQTVLNLAAGVLTFSANHTYLDDNPSGTASDVNTIHVDVVDKDGGADPDGADASVTVNNVAPVVGTPTSNSPTPEGSSATASASFTDVGTQDTHTCSINWGDLTTTTGTVTQGSGSGSCSGSHTYADNGSYTITFTITDDDTGSHSNSVSHTVNNVPPSVGTPVLTPSPSNEGSSVNLSASFTDPGTADTHTCSINWGDGSPATPGTVTEVAGSGACTGSHTYDDGPNTWTVTVTVTDDDGAPGSNSTSHTVNNVPPTAAITGAPVSSPEGTAISLGSNVTDPSTADTSAGFTYSWTVTKNGNPFGAAGTGSTYTFTPDDQGSYVVTFTAKDKDNGTGTDTKTILVTNVNPTATLANNGPVNEGTPATITFSNQLDPSAADTTAGFHYAYACDNSPLITATYATSGTSASTTCTFNDNGTHTVRARIIDKDDGFTEYTTDVTVNNVAPTINDNDLSVTPGTINENGSVNLSGTFTDPGAGDSHTVTINWGDGSPNTVLTLGAGVTSFGPAPHQYLDDNPTATASDSTSITVTVTDDDNDSDSASASVTVNNVPPVVATPTSNSPTAEGASATASATFTDVGTQDTHTCSINWGDGNTTSGSVTQGSGTGSCSGSHSYADNGSYTITFTITDDDTGSHSASVSHSVTNVTPAVTIVTSNTPTAEGASASATATFTDAGTGDTHTCSINWGDSSSSSGTVSETNGSGTCTGTHTYADNGSYTITFTITDDDGAPATGSTTHVVTNVPPTVNAPTATPSTISENDSTTLTGSFTDPGVNDTHTVVINWGDGTPTTTLNLAAGVLTYSATHQYKDDKPSATAWDNYTITVTVTDKDAGTGSNTTTVRVNNVNPVIGTITGPINPVQIGSPVTITATFTDVGTEDTHTCTINWGDASTTPGTVSETNGSGTCSGTHTYTAQNVYEITVTVTDDDTGSHSKSYTEYVVIFDPNGAFVTGGGWINSPPGAYAGNPAAVGKANFGFVSKYKPNKSGTATAPEGETEFQFKAGDLNFHSASYEWLVVSGAKARYRGVGTINGSGSYAFELTAWDGQVAGGGGVDRIRMKIWATSNGTGSAGVIYDNQMAAPDGADPTTTLGGGSIVIHK